MKPAVSVIMVTSSMIDKLFSKTIVPKKKTKSKQKIMLNLSKQPIKFRLNHELHRWFQPKNETITQKIQTREIMSNTHLLVMEFIFHPEDSIERANKVKTRREIGAFKVFVREQYKHNPDLFKKAYQKIHL